MKLRCWKCRQELDLPEGRLSFRAVCDHCLAWLHVCKNCRYHKPGQPNECEVPSTLPISDREAANFCEDFSLRISLENGAASSQEKASRKLFGEEENLPKKKPQDRFNDLFQ